MQGLLHDYDTLNEEIKTHRRWLHQHPELGFELPQTVEYVKSELQKMGYKVEEPCQGALLASVGSNSEGPCFLLRADMDALPIVEQADCSFASTNGNMHACGHDTHTAMLLGAAHILKEEEKNIHGIVKILFQPNEEGDPRADITGGEAVLNAGVLQNPSVDAAASLHVMAPDFLAGDIAVKEGIAFSSIDDVVINIQGKGSHGSQPHMGIDPIAIACAIYTALEHYIARELDPNDICVATFGQICAGNAANVIPDTAYMLGTLRTQSNAVRSRFKERAVQIVEGIATAMGGSATIAFERGVPCVENNPELTRELNTYAEEFFGHKISHLEKPFSGTDDIAWLSTEVPLTYYILGATDPEHVGYGMHNPHIVFNEEVFAKGAQLLANSAMQFINSRA